MALTLYIGNKNYSSWSMRPWIAMKVAGIAFEEKLLTMSEDDFRSRMLKVSETGKVPTLVDGKVTVWETLAILEYLAEKFPDKKLWPSDRAARAHARAIASEMHAGFVPLRKACPMNMWRPVKPRTLESDAAADAARIDAMWSSCRTRFGQKSKDGGPFLFGAFGAADAMYVPMVSRFHTYGIKASATSRAYIEAVMALPAFQEWATAGIKEPWVLPHDEVDWPTVLKV